jgi:hypothetical protein
MRVRMLTSMAGDPMIEKDAEHDFPQDEAIRLIEAGFAVPVVEKAAETPEKPRAAVEQRSPAKKRRARRNNPILPGFPLGPTAAAARKPDLLQS